jgi:hypothetical protein
MRTSGRSRRARAALANTIRRQVLDRLAVTPAQFRRVAYLALGSLTLIVLTGGAVRLTERGWAVRTGRNAGERRCRRSAHSR